MWIATDPGNPRRRAAFDDQQDALRYASQLNPPWTVQPADAPGVAPITGRPAGDPAVDDPR